MIRGLYPYQTEPVRKFRERGNLLVSYEMGTGKTPIALACAEETPGLCLIVCPASLRLQWQGQIRKFTDSSWAVVPAGPAPKRRDVYVTHDPHLRKYLIMSYETVVADARWIRKLHPAMVVLDEASMIKSFRAQRTKKVKQILVAGNRLALTGTPMENRPDEVYSIMQWVDPEVLGRWDLFERTYIERDAFGGVQRYKNLPVLHRRLAPAQARARRSDPEVRSYLPAEDYDTWTVDMPREMSEAYVILAKEMRAELDNMAISGNFDPAALYFGDETGEKFGMLGAIHLTMEMLLDHPGLVENSEANYCRGIWPELAATHVRTSPKLSLLRDKVTDILGFSTDSKVIVFTKFRKMAFLLRDAMPAAPLMYHGDMTEKQKHQAIDDFKAPENRILVSTHAGAYGTDMYMANYLIKYDLPYSFGKDSQISGRHARAASEFSKVYVRDIITAGTIEERNLARINFKRQAAEAIVDDTHANDTGDLRNDVETLRDHLDKIIKKG